MYRCLGPLQERTKTSRDEDAGWWTFLMTLYAQEHDDFGRLRPAFDEKTSDLLKDNKIRRGA